MGEQDSPLLQGEGLGERFFYPPSIRQLIDFENWIETWKKDYQNYRLGARQRNYEKRRETQETPVSSSEQERWRDFLRNWKFPFPLFSLHRTPPSD
jgi:uncharacterized protein (DUF2384 family)